jgi:peptide/nickel transport system substrate-binding protein
VVARGQDTVQVTTTEPRNPQWFIRNGLDEIIPVPKSVWDKYPTNMTREMAFIDSVANSPLNPVYRVVDGPYKLSAYEANAYWDFVPNPRYDGHKSYLSKVVFQYETSTTEQFTALKAGTVNVGYLGVSLLADRKQLTQDTMTVAYPLGFNYIMLNLNPNAPGGTHIGSAFQELPVRQALQYGVDQAGIIKTIFHGYGTIDDGTLAPEPPTIYDDPALKKQPYPFDIKRGKELLLKNGWHEVNGVMTKGDMKLEFTLTYASGSQSGANEMQLLKSDWAREGIIANLEQQPFDTVASDSQENSTKWAAAYWGQGNIGGWTYGNPYPSGGGLFATHGAENGGGYSNQTMDALIQKTYEPGTPSQTLHALYQYETYAADQLPGAIFVPWEPLFNVHADNIHGTVSTFNPIGDVIFPNYWWISK